jgi:hypothetical protein
MIRTHVKNFLGHNCRSIFTVGMTPWYILESTGCVLHYLESTYVGQTFQALSRVTGATLLLDSVSLIDCVTFSKPVAIPEELLHSSA